MTKKDKREQEPKGSGINMTDEDVNLKQDNSGEEPSPENGQQVEVETEEVVSKAEFEELQKQYDELNQKYLRLAAEFDNYKKRTERDVARRMQFASEELVRDILPILDDLERAMDSTKEESSFEKLRDGVELVYNNFVNILKRRGVQPIQSVGEPFDPEYHEAMMVQDNEEYDSDIVIQEFEKGYKIGDSVLRHAKVVVSK
ncbi:MAG: nucleotide exchange factor GrpE [Candidatus Marinimicrobia bacterium]|nr:nucleotide exchange factor GrpE [Candidatus Neomarinimicrobiota bacterium]